MGLKPGDQAFYRLTPEMKLYQAAVLSIDDAVLELQTADEAPATIRSGQDLVVLEPDAETEYFTVVVCPEGKHLRLKRLWTSERGYFRVPDMFPILYRKLALNAPTRSAKLFPAYGAETGANEPADESINPRLWNMLVTINTKLGMIMERLHLEQDGLIKAESIPVNISATGIRFIMDYRVELNDVLEIKMLLPTNPPAGVLAQGSVARVEDRGNGSFDVSLNYIDMDDEVRDAIIQYTLNRQREIIRKERRKGSGI